MSLTPAHIAAIDHVRQLAQRRYESARYDINSIIATAGVRASLVEILEKVRTRGRVAIHFHPDRLFADGKSVAMGLLDAGLYKNQYETGISSGSPTAFHGGERHGWEEDLFGGAYSEGKGVLASRPKYGALQVLRHPDGPSPRFGSSYFLLSGPVLSRTTFTFHGSQEETALQQSGLSEVMEPVLAALFRTVEREGEVLGIRFSSVAEVIELLTERISFPGFDPSCGELGRALDSFVEAQVHGPVKLSEDVEMLVADPIYRETETGNLLGQMSQKYGFKLAWHPGYTLPVHDIPEYFRGYATKSLAMRITGDQELDAAKIGAAANSYWAHPEAWPELGSRAEALTHFRRIWHVLVKKALPLRSRSRSIS